MLKLRRDRPEAVPLALAGDPGAPPTATLRIRPATTIEVEAAKAAAVKPVAGMASQSAAVMALLSGLGIAFDPGDFDDREKVQAVSNFLVLIELAALCAEGWDGVVDEAGRPIACDRAGLALLLSDPVHAIRIERVLYSRIHEDIAEGEGSPALPNGGAGEAGGTTPSGAAPGGAGAPDAGQAMSPARAVAPRQTAGAVPSTNTLH